ncbi:MAG: SDH family Clp fold serine proteinase, partial [Verrucomicrobiales bacterium]
MHFRTPTFAAPRQLLAALGTALLLGSAWGQEPDSLKDKTVVIPITETSLVEAAQITRLRDGLEQASSDGAAAVILKIDCPGGFAISTRQVVESLGGIEGVKTYALIAGEAAGGAALVALAADEIYFLPDGVMGSSKAREIEWRGKTSGLPDRLVDKTYSDYAEAIKSVVTAKDRDGALVDGFIDPSIEVKIGDQLLSESDDVLMLEAENPISAGTLDSVTDLMVKLGLEGDPTVLELKPKDAGAETNPGESMVPEVENAQALPAPADQAPANLDAGGEDVPERGFGATREENFAGKVVVIEVGKESLIRKTKFEFMRRILERAVEQGAEAVIFDMHTPGGYLWETRDLMTDLQDVKIPTYTFVNPEASSAGSMIAISTDKIYMHEPSTIGAAAIVAGGEGLDGTMKEKVEQTFIDSVAEIAAGKGRDPDLCMAFVKIELEYTASIPVVETDGSLGSRNVLYVKNGDLLSLNSIEAMEMVDGKPLFADGVAQTIEELVQKEGLAGEIVRAKPFGFEAVADWIVKIAPFLLLLAMAGAYIEVNSPGFGAPGILALLFFGLFFFGHSVAGKLAGYELIGVFLLGLLLLIVEFFVLPGTMIFGAVGMLLVIGALLFAMIDKFDFSNVGGEFNFDRFLDGLSTPIANLIIA